MNRRLIIPIFLTSLILFGCATQTIQQGKDLSSSGIAYSEAVDKLIDVTTDQVIAFDSAELKKARRGSNLEEKIRENNKQLTIIINELNIFRTQTKQLKTYFLNLQALADSPVKEDTGVAVKSLSDGISKLNQVLEGDNGKESLSEDQKTQIGALGGLVAHTIHAGKIKRALERDAEVIGTYLALQENQLTNIADMLKDRFSAENDLFLEEKVIAPYIDKDNPIPSVWQENRKQWIKAQFVNQQLETAEKAAKQLRGVWGDIVQGKSDINSLSVLISDINEFVVTLQALDTANEEATKSKQ